MITSYYRVSDDPPHTTLFPDSRFYTYTTFDKGKAYGMEIKADVPKITDLGLSAFLNYALGRVWFYNPINAGFTTEAAHLTDSSRFLAPMDQTHTLTSGLSYHNSRTRLWGAVAFGYGSGTPGGHGGGDHGHDAGEAHEHSTGPGLCGTRCPSHFTQDVSIGWNTALSGSRQRLSFQFNVENLSDKVHLLSKESTMVRGGLESSRVLGVCKGRVLRSGESMSRLLILGATGSLGRHVLRQAVAASLEVTAFVRTPAKLSPDVRERVSLHPGDLSALVPLDVIRGQDTLIDCAGHVADGETFVGLVDRLVTAWTRFRRHGAAGLLVAGGRGAPRIDSSGCRGVELPRVKSTYWPHRVNFERLTRSRLDWRLLCPGPMVDGPAIGLDRLRISVDALPVSVPAFARAVPGPLLLPVFASVIPQMIVPYTDAAALMLANLARGNAMSRHRVGLALPEGMRGRKSEWTVALGVSRTSTRTASVLTRCLRASHRIVV